MTEVLPVIDRGQGTPVVLLHGAGGSAVTSFAAVMPALARQHRVLAIDLPGAEREPVGGWTLDAVADLVAQTMRSCTPEPALVIGHSLGAAVAIRLAKRHVDLVHHVVLAAAPWGRDARLRLVTALWGRLFDLDRTALAQHLVLTTTTPSWLARLEPNDVDDLVALAAQMVPDSTGVHLDLAAEADLPGDVAGLDAPATALLGEEDVLVRLQPWHEAAAAGLVDVHVWPGGHDVLAQNPLELAALVDRLTSNQRTSGRIR